MRDWLFPSFRNRAGVLFSLIFQIFVVQPAAGQQAQMTIIGEVRTEGDRTVESSVTVFVEAFDGRRIAEQTVGGNGQFEITGLRRETYRLTVSAEGFHPIQQVLALRNVAGPVAHVRFVLSPRIGVKSPDPEAAPALSDLNAPRKARKNFERGMLALREKDLGEAQARFEMAVQEYPCYARAQTRLGILLSTTREFGRAEAMLRKAIQCDPGLPDAYVALAQLLMVENRFADSAVAIEEGVRRFPGAWQFYDQLATAHYNLEEYAKAEQEWLRARSLNPAPPPELHAKLAAVYLRQGANTKAYAEMQAYLRAEPNGRFAARAKSIMQQLSAARPERTGQAPSSESSPPDPQ